MISRITLALLLASPAACMAADYSGDQSSQRSDAAAGLIDPTGGNANLALQRWRLLSQSDNLSFEDYAAFLVTYPGWPEDTRMRRNAEQAIDINSFSPARVIAYFERFEPTTNAGAAKYAVALQAAGRGDEAVAMARQAWRGGTLTNADEVALQQRFGGRFTRDDHDARMDALLWARATGDARQQLALTSPTRRPVFEARLAQLTESRDANARANAVLREGSADPGFLADRARYLRATGNSMAARSLLANRPPLATRPADIETWFEANLLQAEAAHNDRQWSTAYRIAERADDALPPLARVADLSSRARDKYSDLMWIGGTAALHGMRRPADAVALFDRYARSYDSPNISSKGFYWAGRAAAEAGMEKEAKEYFERAARFPAYFYGQLAHERLGRPLPEFRRTVNATVSEADRRAFDAQPLVIATKAAAQSAPWRDQIRFYRALAYNAKSPTDYALLSDLSSRIGRRDLGVIAGISMLGENNGAIDATLFPFMNVPAGFERQWTAIHAITRQESQFAEGAISHAGARGLMQLMPGTAREQAGKTGLFYDRGALTTDEAYNIKLGAGYFDRMLSYYGGAYPLAFAAYNAGPGNVNKWLRRNGDPRMGGIDWVRWIEDIPISETRNYVKRVLENAVVYDTLNPRGPTIRSATPLSRYIGKNDVG